MTVEAQRPTGRPGDSPTGPAGPGPSGPAGPRPNQPTPRPDTEAPPPASPKQLAEVLDTFDLLLRSMQVLDACELGAADPADRMRLTYALDLGRRAVADLNSGREGRSAAAVSRPVQPRAGRPPSPGAGHDFRLPRDVRAAT